MKSLKKRTTQAYKDEVISWILIAALMTAIILISILIAG